MKKYILISFIITLFFGLSFVLADFENIQYPVAELGNCADEEECEEYCEKDGNMSACLDFAEKYNLIDPEEIEMGRKMLQAGATKGPGGCRGNRECEAYCDKAENMKECIEFAKKYGIIPPEELEEAEKVLSAIEKGAVPPPCKGKKDCDKYCSQSAEKMKQCIIFAKEAGLIPPEELADVEKVLEALEKGIEPLPCAGKEDCDEYCGDENHFQECIEFARAAGFISEEEYEMAKKTGGKGPGGCKGKEECESFCQEPENQKTCFEFAKEHDLISEEDLAEIEKGKEEMKKAINQAPPEVIECLKSNFGQDVVEKIQAGEFMPPREEADKIRQCFEQFVRPEGAMPPPEGMPGGQTQFVGPGGCTTPEECQNYCTQNPDACSQFMPPGGTMPLPPEGSQPPPEGIMPPPPEGYQPPAEFQPPEGATSPPPTEIQPPLPSSFKALENLLASLITIFAPK